MRRGDRTSLGARLGATMLVAFGLLGTTAGGTAAQDDVDGFSATISGQVAICASAELAGTTVYQRGVSAESLPACRLAGEGEATIGLYESETPADDQGGFFKAEATDATGAFSFAYDLFEPYVYLAQGTPNTPAFTASNDIPVLDGDTVTFLVVNFVADDSGLPAPEAGAPTDPVDDGRVDDGREDASGDEPPPASETADRAATVNAVVLVCDEADRAGEVELLLGETSAAPADCRPAAAGEFTVDLYESATAEEDPGVKTASQATDGLGIAAFAYDLAEPFVYLGIGDEKGLDVPIAADQALDVTALVYQDDAAAAVPGTPSATTDATAPSTVITGRVLVCVDDGLAGETRFVLDATRIGGDVACRGADADESTVELFASDTPEDDPGTPVTSVANVADGYFGFTYTGGEPFIYLAEGPADDRAFSDDLPVTGEPYDLLIIDYVSSTDATGPVATPATAATPSARAAG